MVFSNQPLKIGETFTIRIDNIITVWCGSIEVGLAACDPLAACQFPSASSIELSSWVLSGEHLYVDSQRQTHSLISDQSSLDDLKEGDTLGVRLTGNGDMEIFVNGISEGIAAREIPLPSEENKVWAVIDMYGACQQISVHNEQPPNEADWILPENLHPIPDIETRNRIQQQEIESDGQGSMVSTDFTSPTDFTSSASSEVSLHRSFNSESSNPLINLGPSSSFEESDPNVINTDHLDIERSIEAPSSPMANVETYSESETDSNDSNDTSEADDDAIHGISHDSINSIERSYLDSTYDLAADGIEHSEESNPLLEALNDNDIMNSPGELRKVFLRVITISIVAPYILKTK